MHRIYIQMQSPLLANDIAAYVTHCMAEWVALDTLPDSADIIVTDRGDSTHGKQTVLIGENGAIRPPFHLSQLHEAIVRALPHEHIALNAQWHLNATQRQLEQTTDGQIIGLTEKETTLLQQLLDASPHGLSKDTLLKRVWAYDPDINTHTLETHIYRLRQKLEPVFAATSVASAPHGIQTEADGYRWAG